MTNQATDNTEAYLDAYERRQLAARAWLIAPGSTAPDELERLRRESDAEAPTGATVVWMLLVLAGAAVACMLLYFRAPLWHLLNAIPWWAWFALPAAILALTRMPSPRRQNRTNLVRRRK